MTDTAAPNTLATARERLARKGYVGFDEQQILENMLAPRKDPTRRVRVGT